MLIYLSCVSALLTYYIFNSKGIDYRAVALGSLLPFFIDVVIGNPSFGHSILFPVLALIVVMIATIGRPRLLRRRWLCLVIGIFFGLVLEGSFLHERMWWWPSNISHSDETFSLTPSPMIWIIRDVIGLIALYVLIAIGDLHEKEKRKAFFKTGRL